MTCFQRRFHPASMLFVAAGLFLLAASTVAGVSAFAMAAGARPARPTVAVLSGGAEDDLKVLREILDKAPGVKFKAEDLKLADFGKDGGKFTSFFTIDLDLAKSDLGPLAKAVASANTSKKDTCPPGLYLILKYRPDSIKNEPFRAALSKLKGLAPAKSWAGDNNLWVSVDGTGQAKLAEITRALHDLGVKFRDPILDRE